MSTFSSSQPPLPTFGQMEGSASDVKPVYLLDFLERTLDEFENDKAGIRDDLMAKRTTVFSIISQVSAKFPYPDEQLKQWHAMHEHIKLADATLLLVQGGTHKFDRFFSHPTEFVMGTMQSLLRIAVVADRWTELPVERQEKYPNPDDMRAKAIEVATDYLTSLGKLPPARIDKQREKESRRFSPLYEMQKRILCEFLDMCDDLLTLSIVAQYPLQATFMSVPRLRPTSEASAELGTFDLDSPASALRLLTLLCEVCVRMCFLSGTSQWHLDGLTRRAMSAVERTLDLLLSVACTIPLSLRVWLLTRLAVATISTSMGDAKLRSTQDALCSRLMLARLRIGPSDDWELFDADVQKALQSREATSQSSTFEVQSVIMQLKTEQWEEGGVALRALSETYLLHAVASIHLSDVQSILDSLDTQEKAVHYPTLLPATKARKSSLDQPIDHVQLEDPTPHPDTSGTAWRELVEAAVEVIIDPDFVAWMHDDNSFSDVQFAKRALNDVKSRYIERPLCNTAATGREEVARALSKLPCLLAHGGSPDCRSSTNRLAISSLDAYLEVASKLLDGSPEDVPPKVRKPVYAALASFLTHYSHSTESDPGVNSALELVQKGLKDADRSVRLAAGQSSVELVNLYQRMGPGILPRIEPLFTAFLRILDNNKNERIKETLITTLGRVGRIATPEVLGQTLYCLISPLGQKNPLVRSSIHVQLRGLANFYKKTPYALVDPFLPQLAPFLMSKLASQPTLMSETCRFLGLKPDGFIYATLDYTLPQLFATYNDKAIKAVIDQGGINIVSLFMEHAHRILAYAFRLQAPGQTHKVLNFTVGLLKDLSQSNLELDVSRLVASCRTQLFTELVIALGDEDPDLADYAKQALRKAERALRPPSASARSSPGQNISAFLSPHVLGIIAGINDQLQFSKRTVESKRTIIRSMGGFAREMGSVISLAAPQIMTTLQTMLVNPDLTDATLRSWREFLVTLDVQDLGPYVGPTSAFFVMKWPTFSSAGKEDARACINYIVCDMGVKLGASLDEVVDLTSIPQLGAAQRTLATYRKAWGPPDQLEKILYRLASENVVVCMQALQELKAFMTVHQPKFTRSLASGDYFDPLIGRIVSALFAAACRDGEDADSIRTCAFECLGILGAVDPDRFELSSGEAKIVVWENFVEEAESFSFVLHLIADVLVGAFRSTSDIKYQGHLAFAIQELMRFCKFSPGLVGMPGSSSSSIPLKVRLRWDSLPKQMLGTLSPLLSSRYTLEAPPPKEANLPVYPTMKTYREWIQTWTTHLLTRTSGERANAIFNVFYPIVGDRDVGIVRHLLPHLVLHVLVSGQDDDVSNIRSELLAVLGDQIDADWHSTSDKKLLSAQTVFILLDHISYWRSVIPHKIAKWKELIKDKMGSKSTRQIADTERALVIVDSLLSNIDQNLMAKAALQCKAYARSLMNFEQQVLVLRERKAKDEVLYEHYERLHEIYAHLDEPDGMEGISTLILSPSLEHQIRQHESSGRWTSAQSCWEVRLQSSPDNLEYHLGLMRCLRNLGHYDTLRTHVKGIITRYPEWESHLVGFHVESELMVGNWDAVQRLITGCEDHASSVLIAQLLLALRSEDTSAVTDALSRTRLSLGSPIIAAGPRGYRRSYDAVLDLHLVYELETIHRVASSQKAGQGAYDLSVLSAALTSRLNSTLPTFRTQEPILNMRRIAFSLISTSNREIREVIGDSWLTTAKIARKTGHWQTAYSAMLQAQQCKVASCFLESARLVRASGEHLRALQELENYMRSAGMLGQEREPPDDVIDLTDEKIGPNLTAKAQLLRARWMSEADRFEPTYILSAFHETVKSADKWESAQFYTGRFYDEAYKGLQTERDRIDRGMKMSLHTVRAYVRAIKHGQKFIYQTVPRLLTLWLDIGEHREMSEHKNYGYMLTEIERAIKIIPVYKWYTAFPQIVSRVGHENKTVYKLLASLIARVISEYPQQSLWLFVSAVKSTKAHRAQRGRAILDELQAIDRRGRLSSLIKESLRMIDPLVELCNRHVPESKKLLNMRKDFPILSGLVPSQLIVPFQDALTASVPPASVTTDSVHQPFPTNIPTIESWLDEIEVMKSLARPKKLALKGSDGQTYMFLGKPKDDLRKDARLMDLNAIINKLLKANTESRRRQLYIRTYGVVTLNEECGLIQWVPNTIPIRPILNQYYERLNIKGWTSEMSAAFAYIKTVNVDKEAAKHFEEHVLSRFPPMFHNWFLEQFPEPTAWLSSRVAYSRTAAVMSMVGFILGLGDRHSENILLDTTTGDVVHVDFNCLFEKGKQLETPERVPFRLTQNIIDGFGITGVEGVFRIACEVTMQLLRDNKDTLMSVLDAFIHDPLVEWEDEKRKKDRENARKSRAGAAHRVTDGGGDNFAKANIDLRKLALEALSPIAKKLNAIYTTSRERPEKETSISNLVEMLIREASDNGNLARMYPGWGPWH